MHTHTQRKTDGKAETESTHTELHCIMEWTDLRTHTCVYHLSDQTAMSDFL